MSDYVLVPPRSSCTKQCYHDPDPDDPEKPNCRVSVSRPDTVWRRVPRCQIQRRRADECRYCSGEYEPSGGGSGLSARLAAADPNAVSGGDV